MLNLYLISDEFDYGVFLLILLNRFHETIFIIPHFVK